MQVQEIKRPHSRSRKANEQARDAKNIGAMYLRGMEQRAIAEKVGLDQPRVSRTISTLRQEWLESAKGDVATKTAEIVARFEQIYSDAYEAWQSRSTPGHLRNALGALSAICRLYGLEKIDVNLKVGLSSVAIHQQVSQEDMQEAMAELETWHQQMTSGSNPLADQPQEPPERLRPGNDTSAIEVPGEPVEPKAAESEPEPEVLPENYLSITDPNSPDFPLTI